MKYPVFVTDQVLTAKHLNELVDYLNKQNLSTRKNLIGIGVVCGLEIGSDLKTFVNINCGCGVTSRGHLINIPKQELLYYRYYTDQGSKLYTRFIRDDDSRYDLWEILTETEFLEADDPVHDKLIDGNTAFELKDMAVLLYLELIDKDLDNCIDEGCDDKGIMRIFNLRKLLIRKSDLLKIIRTSISNTGASPLSDEEIFASLNPACKLPLVKPHRLNYNLSDLSSLNLARINNLQKLQASFEGVIKKDVIKISQALFHSYELFKDELGDLYPDGNPFHGFEDVSLETNQLYINLKNEVDKDEMNIQYAYDFLCDLLKAYDEFTLAATEYTAKCCVDPDKFPLHLMLGAVESTKKSDLIYRHQWQASPAVSNMKSLLEELRFNHYKISQLTKHFHLQSFNQLDDIKITPGKFSGCPFSEHSMAHYYNNGTSGNMYKHWSYSLFNNCREDTVLSSFASLYSSRPFVLNPLLHSLHDYAYFRIEGHLGQEYKSVRKRIEQEIKDYNLPIDLLGIKLSTDYLDVETDDSCFDDIQTTYKCNRDEYLSCVSVLGSLMNDFMAKINKLIEANNSLLYMPLSSAYSQLPFITHVRHLYHIMNIYNIYLQLIQQQLPEHIKDFKYPLFRVSYFVVHAFTLISQILLEYISNLIKQLSVPFLQFMLLKTLFERMIDDCMDAKFRSLYDMYHERRIRLQFGRLFPGYVEGSPGMEHIAGVKEGGTFILVYDEMPKQEPGAPDEPENPVAEDPCPEDEESKNLTLNVLQYAYVLTREAVLIEEFKDDLIIKDIREVFIKDAGGIKDDHKAADANSEGPPTEEVKVGYTQNRVMELKKEYPTKKAFIEHIFEPIDEHLETPKTYRVVADFAVPYRCCRSCLQVDKLPEQKIAIKLDQTEFCFEDPKKYEIKLEPGGGTVESSCGGLEETGSKLFFVPSTIDCGEEDITLSYTVGDQSAQIVVKVYRPRARFSFSYESDAEGRFIKCTNESENADVYEWTVSTLSGEIITTSTEEDLKFYFSGINHHLVQISLLVKKGACKDIISRSDIKIPQEEVEVSVGLPMDVFCSNKNKDYPFTLNPLTGGILEPAAEISSGDNNERAFNPSKASSGEITFIHTYQGKSASCTIKNIKITSSFREVERDEHRILLRSNSDNAKKWLWKVDGFDHGQGEEIEIFFEKHQGKDSVMVNLEVSNKECADISEQEILLHRKVPGIIEVEKFGNVKLAVLRRHELYERLPEYDFIACDMLIEFHDKLVKQISDDAEQRASFIAGKINSGIAREYGKSLEITVATILKAKEKSDKNMSVFLTTIYSGELQQLLATIAALDRDPAKNSNLYKTLANAEEQIAALKEKGIDINPDNAMKSLIEKSIPQLSDKKNTTGVLTKIGSLI